MEIKPLNIPKNVQNMYKQFMLDNKDLFTTKPLNMIIIWQKYSQWCETHQYIATGQRSLRAYLKAQGVHRVSTRFENGKMGKTYVYRGGYPIDEIHPLYEFKTTNICDTCHGSGIVYK